MPAPLILVDASPRNPADGAVVPFRVAGGGGELPYPKGYRGGIVQLPKFVASLDFDEDSFGTGGVATASVIEWAASVSDLAAAAGLVWEDAAVTVRIGPEGGQPPIALQGKVMKASAGDGRLQIAFADPAVGLKKPFLRDRFKGTGGLEGPVDWTGTIKRRVFGRVWNLPGSPIDPANNIYCFADPLRQINAFTAVRDKGAVTQQLDQLAWQGTPEATLAALQAADAPEGGGIACPSIACVKWWTQPAGELTADLTGETAGGYVESTAGIVSRVVSAAGGPAFAAGTLDAAYAARPAPIGLVVENEGTTASQILDQLLGNVSLLWVLTPTGEIVLREWKWGQSTRRVKAYSIGRSRTFRPLAARRTGYRLNQLPMARNSLAAIVLVKDLEIPPEQFLNSEQQWRDILDDDGTRPEDNATVGAPDWSPVGDRTAGEVTDKLDEHDAAFAEQINLNAQIGSDIDAAKADIEGLFETYGETQAAAAYAQIASEKSELAVSSTLSAIMLDNNPFFDLGTEAWAPSSAGADQRVKTNITARPSYSDAQNVIGKAGSRFDLFSFKKFPILPGRKYRLSARYGVSAPTAPVKMYVGVQTFGANGTVGSNNGLFYNVANTVLDGPGWKERQKTFTLADLAAGTTSVRLLALSNYDNQADGSVDWDHFYLEDITESSAAQGSATAAAESVTTVSALEDAAGNHAATAQTASGLAVEAKNEAITQAEISTDKAVIATEKAAAAQESARLAASIVVPGAVLNPRFVDWPTGQLLPTGWNFAQVGVSAATVNKSVSPLGTPRVILNSPANSNLYFAQKGPDRLVRPSSWWVVEIDTYLGGGTFNGAGSLLRFLDGNDNILAEHALPFVSEYGIGAVGTTYQYRKLIQAPAGAAVRKALLYGMGHWPNLGSVAVANILTFDHLNVRPATDSEIKTGTILPAVQASVTTNTGAIADINGAAAFLRQIVAASGSNPAMFEMLAGKNGSHIGLVADQIALGNNIDGIIQTVLSIKNGKAVLNDALIRLLRIAPDAASQIFHLAALEPLEILGQDGVTVQYEGGKTYGLLPEKIVPVLSGLPALATGESYDIRPTNVTTAGFTPRVKKLTAGPPQAQTSSVGTSVAGTPQWQASKATAADAYNGDYQFSFTAVLQKGFEDVDSGLGNAQYRADYSGSVDLYAKLTTGAWKKIGTAVVQGARLNYGSPNPQTIEVTKTHIVNDSSDFGSGANHFGVNGVGDTGVTAFQNVKYSTQTATNESAVSGLIKWQIFPARQ